jgi:hypothetical protein
MIWRELVPCIRIIINPIPITVRRKQTIDVEHLDPLGD